MFLQTEYHKLEKDQLSPAGSNAHQWAQNNPQGPYKAPSPEKSILEAPCSLSQ